MAITASVAAQKMVGFLTDINTGVNPGSGATGQRHGR